MKLITAPEPYEIKENDICVFLAGGITKCPDWQRRVISEIRAMEEKICDNAFSNLVIFNPRRDRFDTSDKNAANEQIEWEFKYLNQIDIFSMYFCDCSIQPICLYELGRYIEVMKHRFPDDYRKRVIISVEPKYKRVVDVVIQANLALEYNETMDNGDMNLWVGTTSYKGHADSIVEAYLYLEKEDFLKLCEKAR